MTNYNAINPGGKEGGNLSKIKIDGTGETKISDNQSDYINIVGDWIFYANHNDMEKLYKMKTDGTEKTKLNDDMPENISAAGDWIYYKVFTGGVGGGTLYKIKPDGSEKTPIGLPKEEGKKEQSGENNNETKTKEAENTQLANNTVQDTKLTEAKAIELVKSVSLLGKEAEITSLGVIKIAADDYIPEEARGKTAYCFDESDSTETTVANYYVDMQGHVYRNTFSSDGKCVKVR